MARDAFGILAALLQVAGYLVYIDAFRRKAIRPNAASFIMFAYGTAFILLLEWHSGASWPMLALPGACAAMSIAIAAMCFRKGATEPLDSLEKATFGLDLVLTLGYAAAVIAIGTTPGLAVPFLIVSNATTLTAFFPMLRSTWRFPERERPFPWVIWTAAYASLSLATVMGGGLGQPALLIYPVLNLLIHAALVLMSVRSSGPGTRFSDGGRTVINRPSAVHGLGMFAGRDYAAGEEIWVLKGNPLTNFAAHEYPNAIGFAPNMWIDPEPPFEFLNHSCAPNAAFGNNGQFYAIRAISRGEEIAMDYSTTEADPEWRMSCACGAANCRGVLRPIQIAFAGQAFPPLAPPALQAVWREARLQAEASPPAFPQLFEIEELPGEPAVNR